MSNSITYCMIQVREGRRKTRFERRNLESGNCNSTRNTNSQPADRSGSGTVLGVDLAESGSRFIRWRLSRVDRSIPAEMFETLLANVWNIRACALKTSAQDSATDTDWPCLIYCAVAHCCDILAIENDGIPLGVICFQLEG